MVRRPIQKKMKGKEWYEIVAPKFLGEISLGETLTMDKKLIMGRTVEASLMEISNDPTKYYITLFFKINKIDNKAYTEFFGHTCTRDFLARIVQKRSSKIETNDVVNFKDGKLRLKGIAITRRRVDSSVKTELRKKIIELTKKMTAKSDIEGFVKSFVLGKIQDSIKKDLNKIYPIRIFEFRKSEVVK